MADRIDTKRKALEEQPPVSPEAMSIHIETMTVIAKRTRFLADHVEEERIFRLGVQDLAWLGFSTSHLLGG